MDKFLKIQKKNLNPNHLIKFPPKKPIEENIPFSLI